MFTLFLVLLFAYFLLFLCKMGKFGILSALIILLLAIHTWLCTNIWWYLPRVQTPEINLELTSNAALEPDLGENITETASGEYHVTLVNRTFDKNTTSANTPHIRIYITPEKASLKKANYHLYINNQDLGAMQHIKESDDHAIITEYLINATELTDYQDTTKPAKYVIKAVNAAGSAEKTLYITYQSPQTACAKYDQAHTDKNATENIALCRQLAQHQNSTAEKAPTTSTDNSASAPSVSTPDTSTPHTTPKPQPNTTYDPTVCIHEEAGRCWDDLEMEAYDKGLYDHAYSRYGDSYYEPDDCDELCQEILADAYEEGYADDY